MGGGIALLCETWDRETSVLNQFQVTKYYQTKGVQYLSSPRLYQRGGGVALLADTSKWELSLLEFNNIHKLEVIWAMASAKSILNKKVEKMIVCSFYCPPQFEKKVPAHHSHVGVHLLLPGNVSLHFHPACWRQK